MYTLWNYICAFWSVVIINCVQPINWKYCLPVHEWLIPELQYAWKLKTKQIVPYQNEKEHLKNINNP